MNATVEPLPLVPATWIDRRQAFVRSAEIGEQTLDAAERKVDAAGMRGAKRAVMVSESSSGNSAAA